MNQPHVHDILRRWRTVADSYADTELGARVFVSEAWVTPGAELAKYVRADELHTTFNFDALMCEWSAESQRNVIDLTLAATGAVGAPATWVLANHDTIRVATRYGRPVTGARFTPDGMDMESFAGVGKVPDGATDLELGRKRARAAVLLELALPGGAYIYQGDELGLDEVEDLPEDVLQDPIWERSNHTARGRDGCRVPIPWEGAGHRSASAPPSRRRGFRSRNGGRRTPQQPRNPTRPATSTCTEPHSPNDVATRRSATATSRGTTTPADVLSFTREPGFRCIVNFGAEPYPLPDHTAVLVTSGEADAADGRSRRGGLARRLNRSVVAAATIRCQRSTLLSARHPFSDRWSMPQPRASHPQVDDGASPGAGDRPEILRRRCRSGGARSLWW